MPDSEAPTETDVGAPTQGTSIPIGMGVPRRRGRPKKGVVVVKAPPVPKEKPLDPLLLVPINWQDYKEYLLSSGLSQSSIRQYVSQSQAFCRLYYSDIQGDKEELYRKINLFLQVKKTGEDKTNIERANKRWALYAIKQLFGFLNMKHEFQDYYDKYGRHIPLLPRKIISKELNPEQIILLYDRLQEPWKLIMALQYETGARISEILQLKNENITDHTQSITLTVRVKGGGKRQLVLMNKTTRDALKEMIATAGDGYIFKKPNGTRISIDDVNHTYRVVGKDFFERPLTSHWLRHSRGVHIYNKNHDILEVKEALGHQDIKTTYAYLKSAGVMVKDIMKKNPVPW